jgi:hypothetical protein
MKYMARTEMIEAAGHLKYCLEQKADEDAQQWALEILNGLYGLAAKRASDVVDAATRSIDRE